MLASSETSCTSGALAPLPGRAGNGTSLREAWDPGSRKRADVKSWPGPIGGARTAVRVIRRAAMVQAYEVALIASFAARVPLQLVGGGFDPARGPLPPVQAHAAPTARPVLLVHGFGGTKSSWSLLAPCVSAQGLTVDAITYRRSVPRWSGSPTGSSPRWTGSFSNRGGKVGLGRTRPGRGSHRAGHRRR